MLLTTKSRYAIMAMVDMAQQTQAGTNQQPIALYEIALRQEINLKYLEQIFVKLRQQGLVCSTKGPGGGYVLVKNSKDIKIIEIILAVEEDIKMTRCSKPESGCMQKGIKCLTHDLWNGLEKVIEEYFGNITIWDVSSKNQKNLEVQNAK